MQAKETVKKTPRENNGLIKRMLEHAHFLSVTIGPRGTGTQGERKAAEYVSHQVRAWGIEAEELTCHTILSMNHYPLAINLLGLLAVVIYPLNAVPARWLAAILALLVAPFMALTIRTSTNPLRPLLPKVTSPSVLGRISPKGQAKSQVVLISHLDSNKSRLTWKPEGLKNLEILTYLTLAVQTLLGILYLAGAILGQRWGIWWISLIPATYLLVMVVILVLDDRTPYSPGANDNAASVAVVLALAEWMVKNPLKHTSVWMAFSGAEETDHFGLRSILQAHQQEMRRAWFIDLEGVGGGDLVFVTRHGIGLHYFPNPALCALAGEIAQAHPEWGVQDKGMVMSEEISTLSLLGYRAICLAGRDPNTGGLPYWHRAEDTYDTIETGMLKKTLDFAREMLAAIDQGKLKE